jgi:uncharacterized protein YutE (UPF0331/DUF86 family)/predicted nucleotidyltransferase
MADSRLTLNHVLPRLRELFNRFENVELAVLFGSIVRKGFSTHDIDIALKMAEGGNLSDVGYIISQIAKTLNVNEDFIDATILDQANPILLSRILNEGIIIKLQPEVLKQQLERAQRAPDALIEFKMWSAIDPKIDKTIITSRAEEIRRNVAFVKSEILPKRVEDLDYKETLALERAMHRIVESMLDICRHLVSINSLGLVESYGEYPQKLAEAGKMPRDLAEDLAKLAGLRNILVHRYLEIKREILYETVEETVEEIAGKFIEWLKTVDP